MKTQTFTILFAILLISPILSEVICPDGNACPKSTTCCLMVKGYYGCCPYENAVCCDDKVHCCPNSTRCSLSQLECLYNLNLGGFLKTMPMSKIEIKQNSPIEKKGPEEMMNILAGFLDESKLKELHAFLYANEYKEFFQIIDDMNKAAGESSSREELIKNIEKALIDYLVNAKGRVADQELQMQFDKVRLFLSDVFENYDKYYDLVIYNTTYGHPLEILSLAVQLEGLLDRQDYYQIGVVSADIFQLLIAPESTTDKRSLNIVKFENEVLQAIFEFSVKLAYNFKNIINNLKPEMQKVVKFLLRSFKNMMKTIKSLFK